MSYEQDPNKPTGGLWKNEEGKPAGLGGTITITEPGEYFTGVYKNDRKEPGSKQPDWRLVLKRKDKQPEAAPKRSQAPQQSAAPDDDFPPF